MAKYWKSYLAIWPSRRPTAKSCSSFVCFWLASTRSWLTQNWIRFLPVHLIITFFAWRACCCWLQRDQEDASGAEEGENRKTKMKWLKKRVFYLKLCFFNWPFLASFFFIFVFSLGLTVNECSILKLANDWIRTADLWCRKWLLYQLSHNHCPYKTFLP